MERIQLLHPKNRVISIRRLGFLKKEETYVKEILSSINLDIQFREKVGIIDFFENSSNILLKILAGAYVPSIGKGIINGYPIGHDLIRYSTLLVDIEDSLYFKPENNVKYVIMQIINYYNLKNGKFRSILANAEKILNFSINDCNMIYSEFNKIQKFKSHLILALLLNPIVILFTNSVTSGSIDKETLNNLLNILHDKNHSAFIFESNNFTSLEKICSRILILKKGRIFGVGSIKYWHDKIEQHPMIVLKCKECKKVKEIISKNQKNIRIEINKEKKMLTVILEKNKDINGLINLLKNHNSEIISFERINPSFEENFRNYIKKNESFI